MAPQSQPQALDVRERALVAATRLFAAGGFEATSLQELADAVGVRKPSLLYHFASKQVLYDEVLEHLLDRWNDRLPRLLLAATSPEGQFEAVIHETVGFLAADPDRARLLLREVLDRPSEMRRRLKAHVRPWVDVVCRYIRKGQEQGNVHCDVDPEAYVYLCMNLVVSSIATRQSLRPTASSSRVGDRDPYIEELLRMVRASLFVTSL